MKKEDLMIDDWVFSSCAGRNVQIIEITNDCAISSKNLRITSDENIIIEPYDNISPIQLTSEILEKNGFKEDSETNGIYWRPDCRKFCIVKELDTWYFAFRVLGKTVDKSSGHICISECNYVHKLQHILKDLEIEKEVVL